MLEKFDINSFVNGWFIGNFSPSLYKTNDVEVGVKNYIKGTEETYHFHKIATEFTVIINGKVKMNNEFFENGDIIVVKPGVITNFLALTDVTTLVVKIPGVNNDKYIK